MRDIGDGIFRLSPSRKVRDPISNCEGGDAGAEGDDVAFTFAAEGVGEGRGGIETGTEVLGGELALGGGLWRGNKEGITVSM